MDSRLSGLELFASISCENFRREKKMKKKKILLLGVRFFRREIRREKVAQNAPFYTTHVCVGHIRGTLILLTQVVYLLVSKFSF